MRRLLALGLLVTWAGASSAETPAVLRVERVRDPEQMRAEGRSPAEIARGERLRQIVEQRRRRERDFPHVLSAPGVDWNPSADRRRGWAPRFETARTPRTASERLVTAAYPDTKVVAFIRIDFANDRGAGASSGSGRFDLSGPDTTQAPIDRPPRNRAFYQAHLEALSRYYHVQTYGRTVLRGDVWPRNDTLAYTVSDMADFGPWEFSQSIYGAAVHMFQTFLQAADSQSVALGDRIPWDRIDRVVLIHAGSDLQSDVRRDSPEDIPSFTLGVADSEAVVMRDVSAPGSLDTVSRATFVPETNNQDGYYGTINGVIAHECGHLLFGFADLYDVQTGLPRVGFFSLMDSGNLVGSLVQTPAGEEVFATGMLPPSIDPFQRFFTTDALFFPELAHDDTVTLAPSQRAPDMWRVGLSSDEYLLLENRWLAPANVVELEQDSLTRVILGPKFPDGAEYDALLPGGGLLVWHVDESVIPFNNSLRVNPDFGFNTNSDRLGISLFDGDGLQDLGDPGSPFLTGSYRDPWFVGNNTTLADDTRPPLVTNAGSKTHTRLDVLSPNDSLMTITLHRSWLREGWPIVGEYPPGGAQLLAVDADGDRRLDVCWAGGHPAGPDSASLFAVRPDGQGLFGPSPVFAVLDAKPRPVMAAIPLGGTLDDDGPSLFAVSTLPQGPTPATPGGQVWLIDHLGVPRAGWPPALPSIVTTPPVILGQYPAAKVIVGCADGRLYAFDVDGATFAVSGTPLAGGVAGRLAVRDLGTSARIAAGGADGDVAVFDLALTGPPALTLASGWPARVLPAGGFEPDFLWLDFDGAGTSGANPSGCDAGQAELVAHFQDKLWAFCGSGRGLPGWGRSYGDTLVAGLGAGDPDGDGFPEVLTQSYGARVAYLNVTGAPSPGWPRAGSKEGVLVENPDLTFPFEPRRFPSVSQPLAADVAGDAHARVVALNASGLVVALDGAGRGADGFPLASGSGAAGAPLVADLDRNGSLDLIVPDRFGLVWGYTLPGSNADPGRSPWPMLAGDAQRTANLPVERTSVAPGPSRGPLVAGSLKAYPNPARRKPVTFAWQMTEPGDVEFRILDTSGHEVASFARAGRQSDNLVVWDPGSLPAGLYLARVRFRGAAGERTEVVPVGVLK